MKKTSNDEAIKDEDKPLTHHIKRLLR